MTQNAASQVLVVGPGDYLAPNGGTSRCEQVVHRAAQFTQTKLMFVPTLFWVDEGYSSTRSVNSQASIKCIIIHCRGSTLSMLALIVMVAAAKHASPSHALITAMCRLLCYVSGPSDSVHCAAVECQLLMCGSVRFSRWADTSSVSRGNTE